MKSACPYCFGIYELGSSHIYECPKLHERIHTITRKGRLSEPLDALTHEGRKGVGRPSLCNCERCFKLDEKESQ